MSFRYPKDYDVIVVGAGHAGCEAALATARLGLKTLVLTMSLDSIGTMPCNPSIGGPAKGHLTREIDALGGEQARNIDRTHIHIRMLNTSKGPAVQALRAQAEKKLYQLKMKQILEKEPNIDIKQDEAVEVLVRETKAEGVLTRLGTIYVAKAVILTTGTFMRGLVHSGEKQMEAGRAGEAPSVGLSANLKQLGFEIARFKTGTPPRVDRKTINFSLTAPQFPDEPPPSFSYDPPKRFTDIQVPCYLTKTTAQTKEIIRRNVHRSAMYSGRIKGIGPRYCPSIEDKIMRFPDKAYHLVFLEPEGLETSEIYVQGMSTSLPYSVQVEYIRTIEGLEKAEILRPGYAVEYDCLRPWQLKPTLEARHIQNLFFAGQINGTSGYEEAGAQGIIAGINAALKLLGKPPLVLRRDQAYIGVLIDDLITKNPQEPYRMLTSRCEYRLLLRHDNADLRLTPVGYEIGLIDQARYRAFKKKYDLVEGEIRRLKETMITPTEETNQALKQLETAPIVKAQSLADLLRRPEISIASLYALYPPMQPLSEELAKAVEIEVKYEGYIAKQQQMLKKLKQLEEVALPDSLDYDALPGLKTEAREKLKKFKPTTLGQASRIPGVNPADLQVIAVYLQAREKNIKEPGVSKTPV